MKATRSIPIILCCVLQFSTFPLHADGKLRAIILDGQNNHDWKSTTPILKWILEDSGRFTVTVSTTPDAPPRIPATPKTNAAPDQLAAYQTALAKWKSETEAHNQKSAASWQKWRPNFRDYDVVIGNYNGEPWPDEVRTAFVEFVRNGGGYVSVHAADNAFPEWPEYNEMIGVGGWGKRNEKSGPMLRFRDGKIVRDETPGPGGGHGAQHEFLVEARVPDHPVIRGLPLQWMHAADELYARLRGPAKNVTVLATAFSAPDRKGTGENEPILMAINYGKGRVFHTTPGHSAKSMHGLGFQLTLARGAEWAATGQVTLPPPATDVLAGAKAVLRPPKTEPSKD